MSEEQLKVFLEKVKGDTSLQEKLKGAVDNDAVVAIAKAAGFSFSADDINKAQSELSEKELEGVGGGTAIKGGKSHNCTLAAILTTPSFYCNSSILF